MDQRDYYAILQVEPGATQEEIRAAYWGLAFQYHPDQSQSPESTSQMQLINDAYDVLGNQEKRAQYDREQAELLAEAPDRPPVPAEPQTDVNLENQKEPMHKRIAWIKNRLKVIAWLFVILTVLFFLSLATGEISGPIILVFVVVTMGVIASIVLKFKNISRKTQ